MRKTHDVLTFFRLHSLQPHTTYNSVDCASLLHQCTVGCHGPVNDNALRLNENDFYPMCLEALERFFQQPQVLPHLSP